MLQAEKINGLFTVEEFEEYKDRIVAVSVLMHSCEDTYEKELLKTAMSSMAFFYSFWREEFLKEHDEYVPSVTEFVSQINAENNG